jgi:hypothetical protein
MKHILPSDLLQKIFNYLVTRPFQEVNALINEIQQKAEAYNEPENK